MRSRRAELIAQLAEWLAAQSRPHTLRVGIDGRTAAGKTTFADELGDALSVFRPVIRAGLDSFHNPRAIRHARGRMSPEGYYRDARDHDAIRHCLLDPLGREGGRYALTHFDLETDTPLDPQMTRAPDNAVLVCDGSLLQRRELRDGFDVVVFLEVSPEISLARGVARDGGAMAEVYRRRYQPGYALYAADASPRERADVVIDVNDLAHPVWTRPFQTRPPA